jgi:hypothetical protein
MNATTPISGGCLCGACRYRSEGAPINIRVCHCVRCQKATGSAFFARILVPLAGVAIVGPVSWYAAESGLRRGFCSQFGTALFAERRDLGVIGLSFGSLDEPGRFEPAEPIWTASKQPWLSIDDGRPQHPDNAPT